MVGTRKEANLHGLSGVVPATGDQRTSQDRRGLGQKVQVPPDFSLTRLAAPHAASPHLNGQRDAPPDADPDAASAPTHEHDDVRTAAAEAGRDDAGVPEIVGETAQYRATPKTPLTIHKRPLHVNGQGPQAAGRSSQEQREGRSQPGRPAADARQAHTGDARTRRQQSYGSGRSTAQVRHSGYASAQHTYSCREDREDCVR